ncbi:MAG TPA: CopD family protein [Dongiaceae bacterium]|jgi:putative copper export protein/mono/diheme cytochrome c family protein
MIEAELTHGLVRGIHVAATMSAFGATVFPTIVMPPALPRVPDEMMRAIVARITLLIRLSLAVAIVAAGAWLLLEARDVAGEDDTILSTIPVVLLDMRFGWLLIARLALLALAVAIFGRGGQAWQRHGAAALCACAVALQAGLGHGTSMEGSTGWEFTIVEALHVLAAGAWLGGLVPLYIVVSAIEPDAALSTTRRFSRLGTGCVIVLAGTILIQGWVLIGGLAGLVGTDYGLVALTKLVLFLALLGFAAANRFRHTPSLIGARKDEGRRRLQRSIAGETVVGVCVILAAGILLTLAPAMHQQPNWPFPYQFSLATQVDPDLRNETLLGATQAIGAFALICLACAWRRVRWIAAACAAVLAWWAAPHLSLLLVPAYPTSFYRSTSGFTAASIAHGAELFAGNCVGCHGAAGKGNGPQAKDLPIPPADLTAAHLFEHSDGEMFWWLTHGMEGSDGNLVMPGFGDQLDPDARWNLIDYVRAHNAGLAMATSGQWPHPMLAPDMTVDTGTSSVALGSLRGQVLRIAATRGNPPALPTNDLAIRTIPLTPGSDAWTAYAIVAGTAPDQLDGMEFLVDSNGWLRRVFKPDASTDTAAFLSAAQDAESHPIQIEEGSHHHH